jgi:tellurite resistance protein TehA-like permease
MEDYHGYLGGQNQRGFFLTSFLFLFHHFVIITLKTEFKTTTRFFSVSIIIISITVLCAYPNARKFFACLVYFVWSNSDSLSKRKEFIEYSKICSYYPY